MTWLNERLIEKQGLSSDDVAELEYLHETREMLSKQAESLDPTYAPDLGLLQLYADLLESLEFNGNIIIIKTLNLIANQSTKIRQSLQNFYNFMAFN